MIEAVVVDASVALKWFVREPDSAVAERLLEDAVTLHAPRLLRFELANALWKNWHRGFIDGQQAAAGLAGVGRIIGRWHDTDVLLPDALVLAQQHRHPVYDLCYVVLARSLGLPLLTADDRLIGKLAGTTEVVSLKSLS